ncbi:hypothetical protein GE061_009319 [Apolygus lucorum]|uniref:Phosphomannomutase n=1 Tax=Apolygus lucorum TaxID=248454 RepID=A0A6A4KHQ9_APOLU|nr:hypothetical protein GE061_009319 [Apolygus lucorum]
MSPIPGTICLFDVDGTITESRQVIDNVTLQALREQSQKVSMGLVGGSDYAKAVEQLGGEANTDIFEYIFSENGLVARRRGEIIAQQNISKFLGEELVQKLINHCLGYMSKLELPVKRGTFIEYRSGMINVCPVGRSCSQAERKQFAAFDEEHKIREKFVADLKDKFADTQLSFAIGGEISIDVFPKGWDKTYCLRFLREFPTIHFFGDKTHPGGNDHEIYTSSRVIGHKVSGPEDTVKQLKELFP